MPLGQPSSRSGAAEDMSQWPFGVESWPKANVGRGPRERRRPSPLCAHSGNGRATSDFDPWSYAPIINHFRAGTKNMWIPPWVQQQGAPDGTRRLRSFT